MSGNLRNSVSLPQPYQENPLDISLDTFPSLVSISEVRECVTKTLQEPQSQGTPSHVWYGIQDHGIEDWRSNIADR